MMRYSGIGGQAVLEGVMMKNRKEYAVAVRKPDKEIEVKKDSCVSLRDKSKVANFPIVRGVVTFVESLKTGMSTLNYSTSFYEEDEKKEMTEEEKKKSEARESIVTGIVIVLAIVLAIGIFVVGPFLLSEALRRQIRSPHLRGLLEGVVRVALFVGYVKLVSLNKDIKRVFMYHGAEHKSINCIEQGKELTVENAREQSTQHKRCGTSFLLIVMLVSILLFMFIVVGNFWLRISLRILLVPVIAGLAYEFIRYAGSHENRVMDILSKPGLLLQGLTTAEPTDDMLEVAIASVEAVFDWKAFLAEEQQEEEQKKEAAASEEEGKEAAASEEEGKEAAASEEEGKETAASEEVSEEELEIVDIDEVSEDEEELVEQLDEYFGVEDK